MENVIKCIHGLEYDTCSVCYDRSIDEIKEEVDRASSDFSWREPVVGSPAYGQPGEIDYEAEIEYDFDYDFEDGE